MAELVITIGVVFAALMILGFALSLLGHRMKIGGRPAEAEAAGAGELKALLADAHAEIAKVKDRVSVLERLATDEDRRLADEIDRLGRTSDGMRG